MADENKYLLIGTDEFELNVSGGSLKKDDDNLSSLNLPVGYKSLNLVVAVLKGSGASTLFRLDKAFIDDLISKIPVGQDAFETLAGLVPDGFGIDLDSALLIISRKTETIAEKPETSTRLILGVQLDINLNLSGLPLVGKVFPPDQSIGVDNLQVLLSSAELDLADTAALKTLVPNGAIGLPLQIRKGANLAANMSLGVTNEAQPIELGLSSDISSTTTDPNNTPPPTDTPNVVPTAPTTTLKKPGYIKWFPVNKTFGPMTFRRIGGRYHNNSLYFLLDAQLALGPLTVDLFGLSVGSSLNDFKPEFNLDGLGLTYNSGAVAISGAFLKDDTTNSYAGTAVIRTPNLSLSALGAYQEINGQPSIFIYAVLNLAVGVGPAFLQVTGIAAGFGYNRKLNVPPVDRIKQFPLVSTAVAADPNADTNPASVLASTAKYIPASSGDMFFALGIKFNSFKLVDCFALLILTLGKQNRLYLLGLGKLTVPTPPSASVLAQVELAIKAFYDFDTGTLEVVGRLTRASFIFSRSCSLTGGFAFCSWFDGPHAGDFVFSMGGYHPRYRKPAHYPSVPRLGFHWRLSSALNVKGSMYYALVPGALMAGGRLDASFVTPKKTFGVDIGIAEARMTGQITASFKIGADFLIAWQPFYYEADIYLRIAIRASFEGYVRFGRGFFSFKKHIRKSFNVGLGAELSVKGPEFSGVARVNWNVVSFTIRFGNQGTKQKDLTWAEFKAGFLPADDAISSFSVTDGLVRELEDKRQVVRAADMAFSIDTVIPLTDLESGGYSQDSDKPIHVASMGDAAVTESTLSITLLNTDTGEDISDQLTIEPVYKSAPAALWGESKDTGLNSENALLDNLLMGCRIVSPKNDDVGKTEERAVSDFSYDVEPKPDAWDWVPTLNLTEETMDELSSINTVKDARDQLLAAAGLATEGISLDGLSRNGNDVFLVKPKQVTLAA